MNKNHNPSNVPTLDLIISASKDYHKPCPAKNYPIIYTILCIVLWIYSRERWIPINQARYGTRKTHQCSTETKILKEKTQVQPPMSFDPIQWKRHTHAALDKIRQDDTSIVHIMHWLQQMKTQFSFYLIFYMWTPPCSPINANSSPKGTLAAWPRNPHAEDRGPLFTGMGGSVTLLF